MIATIGSLGDLHPCLALALELERRGHHVTIAAAPFYRDKVRDLGFEFHGLRPDWDPTDSELIRRCEELKRGPEILFRQLVLPHLRATYDDLALAAADADLMIVGELVYAAPLVAEKLNLPWASVILSPCSFFSSRDPSVLVNAPWLIHLRRLGWRAYLAGLELGRLAAWHWWTPVRALRAELGLRRQADPLFKDKFSPHLVLALFSACLAQPQPDWPPQTRQPGFVFYDRGYERAPERGATITDPLTELNAFLALGDAPIVFTLGSTVVHNPGNFYEASAAAAKILGRRAVLLGVPIRTGGASANLLCLPYAPHSMIFPHAVAIVHQGGSGTTGQALRAGRPMLIVPYAWDQPDNAARVVRLGTGLTIPRNAYSVHTASSALRRLITEPMFTFKAAAVARGLQREDAVKEACDAIEAKLAV